MSEVLVYIGKVLVIQAIFYGFYRLVLRRSIRHGWNRLYFLTALILSFFIPVMQLPEQLPVQQLEESPVIVWLEQSTPEFEMVPVEKEREASDFSVWQILPWVYVLVTLFLIGRMMVYLFFIQKLKKHSEYVKKRWFKLFKTSHTRSFSFFSNVFIPKDVFGSNAYDQILAHECVHVKQRHSFDRLLMDFLVSLFWFNPFIYLYRNALIEIHEFQADEAVINQFSDPIGYQEVLYSELQHATYSGLVSHFNFSMIKKRIVMMNKQKNKYAGLLYALTLPVLVSVIFAFSNKEAIEPIESVGNELAEMLSTEAILKLPASNLPELMAQNDGTQQDDYVPSIMPVKSKDLVRLSSEFGYRIHPIYKVKKMHLGVDFACKSGTEVIATADGTIAEVETKFSGYGKKIVVDHGNGFKTRFAQLSEFRVKEGDNVKKGDVIALSGNSGASTAPHLHYEVQKGDKRVDPMDYIDDFKPKQVIKEIPSQSSGNKEMMDALGEGETARQELLQASGKADVAQRQQLIAKERLQNEDEFEVDEIELPLSQTDVEQLRSEMQADEIRFEKKEGNETSFKFAKNKESDERTTALFVVNGEEVEGVSDIDPDNIQSIVVLKGKKAKDKYGKKAVNGVIEITTKEKKRNKLKSKKDGQTNRQTYRVIIDPGHGGMDPGATSPNGLTEADIALQVSRRIKEFLVDENIELVFTRTADEFISLKERSKMSQDADLFLSLHTDNYENQDESFILPIYFEGNEYSRNSLYFATLLSQEFEKSGQYSKVGSIYECAPQPTTKYDLLGKANCPAVLLNIGYFSNRSVEKSLSTEEGQRAVASHIAEAIKASRI